MIAAEAEGTDNESTYLTLQPMVLRPFIVPLGEKQFTLIQNSLSVVPNVLSVSCSLAFLALNVRRLIIH